MLDEDGFVNVSVTLHCGVYALVKKGEVVYVGKSKRPLKRIEQHRVGTPTVRRMSFDSVWVLGCMLGQVDVLERRMIEKYHPRFNVRHNNAPIPEDIRAIIASMCPELPPSRDTPARQYMVRRL